MKKIFTTLAIGVCSILGVKAQMNISDARLLPTGSTVTVEGVVTNGQEFGGSRFLQDATGGIGTFASTGSQANYTTNVNRGTLVRVTGTLSEFQGLLQISPVTSYTVISNGNPLPAAVEIPADFLNETYEGVLVKIVNTSTSSTGNYAGNTNYNYTWNSLTYPVRANSSSTGLNGVVGKPIQSGPMVVTGIVGQFQTTYQLLPRLIEDITSYTPPATEINIKKGTNVILTGSTVSIGNAAATVFTIENLGASGALTISSATITGTDASMFSFSGMPSSVATTSSSNFTLNFAPTGAQGTKTATLTLNNNDSDEGAYVIHIEAVFGTGATEPAAQPTALNFTNQKSFTHIVNYTASASAQKYIVLRKAGSPISDIPADNNTYQKGDYIGTSQVAYIGSGVSFTPRQVIANTTYYFAVFAYNGNPGFENYLQNNPLTGSVTSSDAMIGTYYSTGTPPNINSATFLTDLSAKINPHTALPYVQYPSDMIDKFEARDTTLGRQVVTCVYSGENKIFTGTFAWTVHGYSREHSYCHSWMPTFPADAPTQLPEYNDRHHLFPSNLNLANSPRSNYPLGEVTGAVSQSYLEGKLGLNALGQTVYEPRDAHKGNAARAIMYVATCYNGISTNNWKLRDPISGSIAYGQDQDVLKKWHFQDPPDNYEIARNDYVFSIQGNRNPYIDSVHFACYVDFDNMVKINSTGSCVSAMTLQKSQTNSTCNQANGTAAVTIVNGTAPYTFLWSNNVSSTATATGLVAGNYTVSVTDNNGQTANANFVISNSANATSFSFSKNDASGSCGNNNGDASVVIGLNPSAPYTYTWLSMGQSGSTATGLVAGNYTLELTNSIGCTSSNTVQINDGAASFGPLTFSTEDVLCNGQNTGSATVTNVLVGATTYLWNTDANNQTNASATGLASGVYTVAVTNSGCTVYGTTPIINQPSFLLVGQVVTESTSCFGGSDGTAKAINVAGGTSPYVYSWNSGGFSVNSQINNLQAGSSPNVLIKDANGCTIFVTSSGTVPQPSAINATFITEDQTNLVNPNGLISIYPSGGSPKLVGADYVYNIVSYPSLGFVEGLTDIYNATAGTYTVVISDNEGCSKTITGVVVGGGSGVGINNVDAKNSLVIYPNPAKDNVTITFEVKEISNLAIEIKDVSGRVVYNTSLPVKSGVNQATVNVEKFAKGVYFISTLNEEINNVTRIIIE
ncbi:MAG: endonuclease [Bacteroidota bacterium]